MIGPNAGLPIEGVDRGALAARIGSAIEYDTNGGCWLWSRAADGLQYGQISVNGRVFKAHRASYAAHVGPLPPGASVCHSCDVPACVNPAHLFLGSHGDNMRDSARKGRNIMQRHPERARVTEFATYRHGAEHPLAKLTEAQVVALRADHAAGMGSVQLGRKYGISRGTAWKIAARRIRCGAEQAMIDEALK